MVAGQPWFAARDLRPHARMRLFCLPHAGSGASAFYRWRQQVPAGVDVCPVQLPGRELRLGEPCAPTVEALVDGLMSASPAALDVPYAIFGHSMGALLGYAWAQAIAAAGLPGPRVLAASGRNAPQVPYGHDPLHGLDDRAFVHGLHLRYGGVPPGLLDDPEMRAVFLPVLRADLHVVETYRHRTADPLDAPVLAVAGALDPAVTEDGLRAWCETTRAGCVWRRLPGDHFFHFGPGQTALLALLEPWLAGQG